MLSLCVARPRAALTWRLGLLVLVSLVARGVLLGVEVVDKDEAVYMSWRASCSGARPCTSTSPITILRGRTSTTRRSTRCRGWGCSRALVTNAVVVRSRRWRCRPSFATIVAARRGAGLRDLRGVLPGPRRPGGEL